MRLQLLKPPNMFSFNSYLHLFLMGYLFIFVTLCVVRSFRPPATTVRQNAIDAALLSLGLVAIIDLIGLLMKL